VLPFQFEELYLDKTPTSVDVYTVGLEMSTKFKFWSLLTPSGWEYYYWLDEFLARIDSAFSFDRFLEEIGWNTALTSANILRQLEKQSPDSN
jgi:hypothetical protein